jgi:hypothetical protein
MADRTFESQQYASQEAVRGEAALSQGIGALAGAATQAGAALERHGDRMAQREQAGAQMAESRRQADQSAGLRREEMGIQREQLDQQGRQFEMTRSHQMADLQFRQQVDARVAANQAAEQEVRNLGVQLQWQDSTAARAEAAARWEQEERKLAILSNTKITAAQLEAQEIQNKIAKTQLDAIEAQQKGEFQRGRLAGRTIDQQMKLVDNLSSTWARLSEAVSADPTLLKDVSEMYRRESGRLQKLLDEGDSAHGSTQGGAPPPRRTGVAPPPPIGGVREMDYQRFDNIVTRSLLGAVRSPKSANQSNARIAGMMFRMAKDGNGIELADPVAYQKWKEAASRFWVGTSADGQSEESFVQSFNRQTEVLMQDHGMTLNEALDYMGSIR